jgi:putative DNA primase/helicase
MGNAERLIHHYGDILRFSYERKRWLVWTGKVWEWDSGAEITTLAQLTVRNIYHEAGDEPDEKKRKELVSHARRSESDHRINAMINQAQNRVPIKVCQLDSDPWLFNCLNGTIDLRTGKLLPHRKEDLITTMVALEYDPAAECPQWLTFLDQVTGGDVELQRYLQRAAGYSLTGVTTEQCLFFLYGLGNNGKTTFLETILAMMGGYADTLATETLMIRERYTGGPRESLANLKGKRLIITSEIPEGRRLNIGLVKDLTGGDTIKADRKYEHEIAFTPTHKIWIRGNHKPIIPDTSLAIWRRIKLIPFTVTIPPEKVDKELNQKLRAELAGILAWAVEGSLAWQLYGLNEPRTVSVATKNYQREQDILADFLEDCCVLEAKASIAKADLKAEYHRWCEDNRVEPIKQHTFRARLMERGVGEGSDGKNRLWRGIRLRTEGDVITSPSDKTDDTTKLTDKTDRIFEGFSYIGKTEKIPRNLRQKCQFVNGNDSPECPGELLDCPVCGRCEWEYTPDGRLWCPCGHIQGDRNRDSVADALGMTKKEALAIWDREGRPLIHLGPGVNCLDLRKLLSREDTPPEHFKAVKTWLEKHIAVFIPLEEWQEIPDGAAAPLGLDFKMDLTTGKNFARLPPEGKTEQPEAKPSSMEGDN